MVIFVFCKTIPLISVVRISFFLFSFSKAKYSPAVAATQHGRARNPQFVPDHKLISVGTDGSPASEKKKIIQLLILMPDYGLKGYLQSPLTMVSITVYKKSLDSIKSKIIVSVFFFFSSSFLLNS